MAPKGIGDFGFGNYHFLGSMLNLGSAIGNKIFKQVKLTLGLELYTISPEIVTLKKRSRGHPRFLESSLVGGFNPSEKY